MSLVLCHRTRRKSSLVRKAWGPTADMYFGLYLEISRVALIDSGPSGIYDDGFQCCDVISILCLRTPSGQTALGHVRTTNLSARSDSQDQLE